MNAHIRAAARRLVVVAGLALAMPSAALAADPPDVTAGDGGAATLLVVLLLGSVTAGLFFASPLRRRFVRSSFASTRLPARVTDSRAADSFERAAAAVHQRLARLTERWPRLQTHTPLPPMLGGDIFFDDDPAPSRATAATGAPASRPSTASPTGSETVPWSTAPVAADERYLPSR
jgi:hypothetical protein